jgi:hypothetical protein
MTEKYRAKQKGDGEWWYGCYGTGYDLYVRRPNTMEEKHETD